MALNIEYKRKIEFFINNFPRRMYKPVGEVSFEGFFTYDRLSLADAYNCDKIPFAEGMQWGKKWEYAWFFCKITIPYECKGHRVEFTAEPGECVVFINGKVFGSFDKEHKLITLAECAEGGESFDIAMEVYAGHLGDMNNHLDKVQSAIVIPEEGVDEFADNITQRTVKNGSFGIFYEQPFALWMDIQTLYDLRCNLDDNSLRQAKIDKALKQVCDKVNIELPFDEFLSAVDCGRKILKPLLECKNSETTPVIYAIGNSHLDLEWLWTRNETRRKVARTLGNQLRLMKEYKDYKYLQSQPWTLEVLKNEYPDLYAEVKEAVKNGSISVEGGTWVEPDTNIPSGESLIRQFSFGKRFVADEFGKNSEIFWLPDSFGMSGALPQIMKGCGIKYFMNAKITWLYNGGYAFPHSVFMWKGIDGTEILTAIIQEYATKMTPSKVFEKWYMNPEKEDVPIRLLPYGCGDGGGGATREHLEYMKRERDLEGMPKVISELPNEHFKYIENECDIKKTFVGEMYYPTHRGTYTSQSKIKKYNRQSEFALREAEMWSALTETDTRTETDNLWKTVLFDQFHDILPGSSITAVNEQVEKDHIEVHKGAAYVTDKALDCVIQKSSDSITVINSLSWERKTIVKLPAGFKAACDNDGNYATTQLIDGDVFALLSAPPCGMKSYKILKEGTPSNNDGKASFILENDFIKAEFNCCGELVSLKDLETGAECLSDSSNIFRLYQDMPLCCDAWDIDSFYENTEVKSDTAAKVTAEHNGALYKSLLISKKIGCSEIRQRVILRNDKRRLDFQTEVDWNETHKLLKVDFNTNINTDEMISEIQFGYVKRPTHKNQMSDADKFEVWQHKWSALAESGRGVAVLNDCKYGISTDNSRMSLTLLKSPAAPALYADKGKQSFTYSLMPFNGSLFESNVVRDAYELNAPALIRNGFTADKSFINVSAKNVIVETVKLASDGSSDIIVRLYECMNSRTDFELNLDFNVIEVYNDDMLENDLIPVKLDANKINLTLHGFEVLTLRLKTKK